jgi:hypothetical protein
LAIGCFENIDLYHEFELFNDELHVSYTWFMHVWKKYYPFLTTSHDRGCVECDELIAKMREADKKSDYANSNAIKVKYDDHVTKSKSFHEYV